MNNHDTITFTIPMTPDALMRTSVMLYGMAEDLGGSAVGQDETPPYAASVPEGVQTDERTDTEKSTRHVAYSTHEQDEGRAVGEAERTADPPQTDHFGVPWDSRVHSGSKTLTADGRWRQRKGISKEYREQIEQELKAPAMPAAAPTPPPAPAEPDPAPEQPAAPAPAPAPEPPPAPAGAATVANDADRANRWADLDFMGLMNKCTEQRVPQETAVAVIKKVSEGQVESLPGLVSRTDLIPQVAAELLE